MRKIRWFLALSLSSAICIVSAQNSEIDSLRKALANHAELDTLRIDILNELSFAHYSIDPNEGIRYSQQAIDLATQLNDLTRLARAFNNKSANHWAKGEDSLAFAMGERALEIHQETGNMLGAAKALNNLALNYYNISDFRKALEYHDKALIIFEELDHTLGIAHSYSNAGVVHLSLSDYPRALENFLNAARHVQDSDQALRANIALNIGLVYKNMKQYEKARQYTNEALGLYTALGMKQGEANAFGNLGTISSEQGFSREALECFDKSLQLNTSIGNKRRIAGDLVNIAVVYHHLGDYTSALRHFRESLELYEQSNDRENTCFTLVKLAELHLEMTSGTELKNAYISSLSQIFNYLKRAKQLAEETRSIRRQQMVWDVMSRAYERQGQHAKALDAYKMSIALRDSIFNSENDKEIARQQILFEYEKKEALLVAAHEKDIAVAHAELQRQKTIDSALIAGTVLLILAAGAGYFLNKKKKDAERQKREAEFQALIAETKMKALRAQMNPHFIFNSLNAISNFIGSNQLDSAEDYLVRFSKVIRMILENSDCTEISLSDDLKILEQYIQLERTRLRDRFSYEIMVDESIDPENTFVPPLILQPIVENSIWHGVSQLKAGGKILIHIREDSGNLICEIDDNGPGRHKGKIQTKEHKSMGIDIARSRLEILNEQKLAGADIVLTDKPEGLRVTVTLPLLQNTHHEHD